MLALTSLAMISSSFAAVFYGAKYSMSFDQRSGRYILKSIPLALLSVAAFWGQAHPLIIAALGAFSIGDAYLSDQRTDKFLLGMVAHVLGILLYITYFTINSKHFEPFWAAFFIGVALVIFYRTLPNAKELCIPAFLSGVLLTMFAIAGFFYCSSPISRIGIMLFVSSHIILVLQSFCPVSKTFLGARAHSSVWWLYYFGQFMLAIQMIVGHDMPPH